MITRPLPADFPPVIPTANDCAALPDVAPDGAVGSIQLLSAAAQGLIGLAGAPLLRPVPGPSPQAAPQAKLLDHWIPRFTWRTGPVVITETLFAPIGHQGVVLVLEASNEGRTRAQTTLGVEGAWEQVALTLFHRRALPVVKTLRPDPWTRSLAMEALGPLPVAGWAIHADPEVGLPEAAETEGVIRFRLIRELTLDPGAHGAIAFYIGLAREGDGARTTALDLRRRGWEALLAQTRAWLQSRAVGGQGPLAEMYHRNALFNRFFACGRTIDTDEFVWVTSRSPRYYVSAAFWSRDAFLWSLPGLLHTDHRAAREALGYAFRVQWRNAGMHAQYLNGGVIYPGFELDELAAFPVGLAAYLRATGDASILDEPSVAAAVLEYPQRLRAHRGDCGLYATFLDPSDDPVAHPFLTYDNVLAWRGLRDVAEVCRRLERDEEVAEALRMAEELERAIWRHCVVDGPHGPMFAWAVDGEGAFQLYDNPPGSLLLLPYYGFCASDHPVHVNTAAWVHSEANPWYFPGRFAAPASAHSPDPWPMAIVNNLLLGRTDGLEWLARAEMDGGLACETVDQGTGRVKSGGAFATFAGLLAAALLQHRQSWPP